MPIIARNQRQEAWQPLKDWPSDTYVQWGGRGVVLRADDKGGSYSTAFFEAMPAGGGFIRGEGKSIEEAEADAFSRFEKEDACRPHRWGRRGYTNACVADASGQPSSRSTRSEHGAPRSARRSYPCCRWVGRVNALMTRPT